MRGGAALSVRAGQRDRRDDVRHAVTFVLEGQWLVSLGAPALFDGIAVPVHVSTPGRVGALSFRLNDPAIHDKMTAVRLTMDLIAKAVEERPEELDLTIGNYRSFIGA